MGLGITVEGKSVFVTPTGIKLGARGKVQHPGSFFGTLPKGEARQVRKRLRAAGHAGKAAFPRS